MESFIQKNKNEIDSLLPMLQSGDSRFLGIEMIKCLCKKNEDKRLIVSYIKGKWKKGEFIMKKDVHDFLTKIEIESLKDSPPSDPA